MRRLAFLDRSPVLAEQAIDAGPADAEPSGNCRRAEVLLVV
jgi:hypothetical protein